MKITGVEPFVISTFHRSAMRLRLAESEKRGERSCDEA